MHVTSVTSYFLTVTTPTMVVAHLSVRTPLFSIPLVKKLRYYRFVAQNFPLICPYSVTYTYNYVRTWHIKQPKFCCKMYKLLDTGSRHKLTILEE